jgi:hypothetical protein
MVQVRYELPNGRVRCYKVNKLMKPPGSLIIPDLKVSVEKYFKVSVLIKLDAGRAVTIDRIP